jgi:ParB-like chromosome segregation protein Spo0J
MIVEISKIRNNTNNPRFIKDDKFRKLVKSIKEFPEMLELRPIVVDEDMIVLGGNMRLKACIEAGLKEVHIKIAENLTEDQKKEFIVKDNVGFGEWDWDLLANEWDTELLEEWGLDLKLTDDSEDEYTNDVKITLSLNNEYLEDFKNELDILLSKHPNVLVKFKI